MAKYYNQMVMEMELRNLSPKTIEAYVWHVSAFAKMFGKSLEQLGENEIRQYLHHLRTVKKVSTSNILGQSLCDSSTKRCCTASGIPTGCRGRRCKRNCPWCCHAKKCSNFSTLLAS
jgi:hypothetical protein